MSDRASQRPYYPGDRLPWSVRWRCWRGAHRATDPQIDLDRGTDGHILLECQRCGHSWKAFLR